MNRKSTIKKTKRPIKNYVFEAKEVAILANCSVSYVKQIRTAKTSGVAVKSELAKKIMAIDEVASNSKKILKEEIKRIVKL